MVKKELPTKAIQKTLINSLIGIKKKKADMHKSTFNVSISILKL